MARLPRLHLSGAVYLITARGLPAEQLFRDPADYETYLRLVGDYASRRACRVFAYGLMPEQVHLCVETPTGEALSGFMHDVTAAYTRYANKRYGRSGHLFQARFHAVVAEKATYLLPITAYVHARPLRAGLAQELASYPFGSYGIFASTRPSEVVTSREVETVLQLVPAGPTPQAYADYVHTVAMTQMPVLEKALEQKIVGSESFVELAKAQLACSKDGDANTTVSLDEAEPTPVASGSPRAMPVRPSGTIFAAGLAIVAAGALLLTLSLLSRVDQLTQIVRALSEENEAVFQAHHAVSLQPGPDQLLSLEGTAWDVRLASANGQHTGEIQQDRVTFAERQFDSSRLTEQGFVRSWYVETARVPGQVTWEVVQTNTRGDMISWKGESQGPFMKGVMTKQASGTSTPESFTFVGVAVNEPATSARSEI